MLKVANSQTIYGGDPVVWTTVTGSENRVRILSAADITALYSTAAVDICGILGVAGSDLATSSTGAAASIAYPVAVANQPFYPVISHDYLNPPDPATGRFRANIYAASSIMSGYLWENTTITAASQGVDVGILRSTISSVVYFFWSTAATTKIGEIYQVDTDDPYYNTAVTANVQDTTHYGRCRLGVRVFPTYQQSLTGVSYAT